MPPTCVSCAATQLSAPPTTDTTAPGVPATGNMLLESKAPIGTNVTVTGFKVPGSDTLIRPGTTTTLVDPVTGTVTGSIVVYADGSYVFTPAAGFVGPVPTVYVTVASSDGQSAQTTLGITVSPMLTDANEAVTIPAGSGPVTVNLLDNVVPPPGTSTNVTSFMLPGSGIVYPVGPNPVTVIDPVTGKTTGTIVVLADGTATFTPASGFVGQAPAIMYTVEGSDGQTSPGALQITVLPSKATRVGHAMA